MRKSRMKETRYDSTLRKLRAGKNGIWAKKRKGKRAKGNRCSKERTPGKGNAMR